jgi:hypothetical protein
MIAIARCLNSRTVEHWLRPILWDVIYDTSSDDLEMNDMLASVKRAVETILRKLKGRIENSCHKCYLFYCIKKWQSQKVKITPRAYWLPLNNQVFH